jgi:hypothetical protein
MPAKKEVDMLDSFKSKAPEKDKNAPANVVEVMGRTVQPQDPVVEPATARPDPTTKAGTASSIGSGMSIVGNIECNGPAQVSIPKIPAGIRAVTQNQRIIRCDVCDHPPACNLHGRSVQVTTPA